jgi:trans-aconitate methyltransferase
MIESARQTYPCIEFLVADARTYASPATFDAIFSNATLHWIPEAELVVQCMATSLKPGGRLVLEMGGKGNIAHIQQAFQHYLHVLAPDTQLFGWYFPSIGQYTPLLERYGLEVRSALLFDRPTKLEDGEKGLRNWMQMFYTSVLSNIPDEAKQQLLSDMEKDLQDALFKDSSWIADYRRLRIVAYKK